MNRPAALAPRSPADLAARLRAPVERGPAPPRVSGHVERNRRRFRARVVVDGVRRTVGSADTYQGAEELLRAFHNQKDGAA